MGNYESIEQLRDSAELKDICYSAVDTLINLDRKYREDIKNTAKKIDDNTQSTNIGSNKLKTGITIISPTSSVNINQKVVVDTVIKTTYYTNFMNILDVKPEIKFIICDILGLTKAKSNELSMPSYSDPVYLLSKLGITNVASATLIDNEIVYMMNGVNTKIPLDDVKAKIHEYYKANLYEKISTISDSIMKTIANFDIAARNASSNDMEIDTIKDVYDSVINLNQSNESKIRMETEFSDIGNKLAKLAKKTEENKSNEEPAAESKPDAKKDEPLPKEVVDEVAESLENSNHEFQGVIQESAKKVEEEEVTKPKLNKTLLIVVGVVVGAIVMGMVGVMLYFSMKTKRMIAARFAKSIANGGYIDIR